MADDVDIPVVSSATVATDEVAGRHFQLVKLTDSTDGSTDPTGVADNPLTVDARMAFIDFDDSVVPVTDNDDAHWLPVTVRSGSVAVASVSGGVQVYGTTAEEVLTGPSDGIWGTDKQFLSQPGLVMLSVRSTGGTPTVAAFGASATNTFGGTFDQQLPLLVPDGDSLVLADTYTPGAGARFCYILSVPPVLEIRAVSGGTSDPVDASLTVNAFSPQILATVSSGGASGDTELTTKDYDSGGGTDTVAVTGILLPADGGAVPGGTTDNPLTVDARLSFIDFDDAIVPVDDDGDEPHWLPVAVRQVSGNVTVSSILAGVQVDGSSSENLLTGPSDGVWVTDQLLDSVRPGTLMLTVRSTGGTPTVAAFGASAYAGDGGVFDQQLPLVVPDGDSLVLADTFTPGVGARFCYILALPPVIEIRAISGGTSDPVDATLTVNAFAPPIIATVSSGGASGDTELTTKDYDSGGGTDTVAVTGILLPKSGGAVAGGTSTDPLRTDPTGTTAQPITDGGGSITVDGSVTMSGTATVSGTVTANAGTNLNTSALATESGGNLAAAAASLSVLDDWDESDRAKVNPIVGQAGVQGGSGAVSATTQRTVLATDVALPAGSNAIGKLAANDGVDVGDVTINNSTGGSAVNIQDGGNSITVDAPIGTPLNVQVGNATLAAGVVDETGASAVDALAVGGATPHDAVDSGNPLKIGGKAATTIPTPVADGDRVNGWFDEYGRQIISDRDYELGNTVGHTGLRDQLVAERYTVLADSLADGISGSWTQAVANGGTVANTSGEGQLKTSTATNGSSQITSPVIPYYPGQVNWMNSAVRFGDTGVAGNIRRIGMFTTSGTTPQDGFYFELSGTTLNAVVVKAATPTAVASTSWSRVAASPFTLDANYHSLEIRYTANSVWFYVDNVLRHLVTGTTAALTASLSLPITVTNVKTSGATDITFAIRNVGNGRFGNPSGAVFETGTSSIGAAGVGGATPHDSVDSGFPIKVGGYASTTKPANVASGDRVNAWLDLNGSIVTTPRFGGTSTLSNVSGSATNVTLLAANTARRSVTIVNDSAAILMVKEGATASATSYSWLLQAYDTLTLDGAYSGILDGIWGSATGAARITERT